MNKSIMAAVVWMAGTAVVLAGSRSGGDYTANDTIDSGGQRIAGANYTIDGSVGGIGGISSNASPLETAKHGYIGQLTEVTNLLVIASPAAGNEGSVLQLTGLAGLDDATVLALPGSNVFWAVPGFPIASITPAGAATAAVVWSNTYGAVTGAYLGVSGSGLVLVLDSDHDNYGIYANDQIPDWWQVWYFGTNNALGVAGATNCTGKNNLYTYTADLDPGNPASVLEIVALSNQPSNRMVRFATTSAGRVYRLLYSTNLVSGAWTNLPGATPSTGVDGQMSLSDTNAAAVRFYQIGVQVP